MLSPVLLWVLCVWWWCVWSRVRVRVFLVPQFLLLSGVLAFGLFYSSYPMQACPVARVCLCVRVRLSSTARYVISNDTAMLIQYKTWLATSTRIASCHAYYHVNVTSTSISPAVLRSSLQLLAPHPPSTTAPGPVKKDTIYSSLFCPTAYTAARICHSLGYLPRST